MTSRLDPMPVRLLPIPLADLIDLSESRIPLGMASRSLDGALPPPFVARRSLDQLAQGKPAQWCSTFYMVRNLDQAVVGSCGFKDAPENGGVEIGYGVALLCRNAGIGSAAVAALLKLAFANIEIRHVLAQVNPDNFPSTRIVENAGFKACGTTIDKDLEVLVQWIAERPGTSTSQRYFSHTRAQLRTLGQPLKCMVTWGFAKTRCAVCNALPVAVHALQRCLSAISTP